MPKQKKLAGKFLMKTPSSVEFERYAFRLEWEGRTLFNRKRGFGWHKIDLAETLHLEVQEKPERTLHLRVWSKTRRKAVDWYFRLPPGDYETWLYWLLNSILKHSKCAIPDEELERLRPTRKGKLQAKRELKAFETAPGNRIFVTAAERHEGGQSLSTGRAQGVVHGNSGAKYKVERKIGEGGQGIVFKANKQLISLLCGEDRDMIFHPKPEPIALKVAPLELAEGIVGPKAKNLIREARILSSLGSHPNLVGLLDVVAATNGIYVMFEMGDESLEDFPLETLQKLSVRQALKIVIGILSGLAHMHERQVYHLDMKPENVVFFGHTPKLIDFGLAMSRSLDTKEDILSTQMASFGSPGYVPPEAWATFPTKGSEIATWLEKRDSYSAGMTILDGLVGPKYGWRYTGKCTTIAEVSERQKCRWWGRVLKQNAEALPAGPLKDLALITRAMIHPELAERLTVREALKRYLAKYAELRRLAVTSEPSAHALKVLAHINQTITSEEERLGLLSGERKAPSRPSKEGRPPLRKTPPPRPSKEGRPSLAT